MAEVPFVDCVNTMLDPGIPLTINEWDQWGDPRDPGDFACLRSYAPYENPPPGRRPALLVTGAVNDPRVLVHEPAKWVARLRATDTTGARLLFRAELGAGAHTGSSGRFAQLRYEAEVSAFILDAMGLAGPGALASRGRRAAPPDRRRAWSSGARPATGCTVTVRWPGQTGKMGTMDLPVMPPVAPMLAKAVKEIPHGSMSFEPKWDGFRSIIFRDGPEVEIGSRNERPMTRYFPEVVDAVLANLPERCVIDGEIVIPDAAGRRLDFEALLQRVHPADSRVRLLAAQTPAAFVAFDLLALDGTDFTERPFSERRAALEDALASAAAPVHLTPTTLDRALATQWFSQFEGAGLDGIVAKPLAVTYQQDKRVMFKVKHERTADCVVAGYRPHKSGPDAIGSLLLGLYDAAGRLASVGVVGAFPMAQRRALFTELQPLVTGFEGHPWNWAARDPEVRNPREAQASRWNSGKDLSFVPLRPERVAEVRYEHMEGTRFRHTAQFVRWRPDRDPASCGFGQLEEPVSFNLSEVLAT